MINDEDDDVHDDKDAFQLPHEITSHQNSGALYNARLPTRTPSGLPTDSQLGSRHDSRATPVTYLPLKEIIVEKASEPEATEAYSKTVLSVRT